MGTLRIEFAGGAGDARALAGAVAASARAAPGAGDDGGRVVLVRRARVHLVVGAAAPQAAAEEAGRALDGALRGALRRPRPDGDVRVFPSTAEYVAHFVEELAAGRVVEVWYFGPLLPFRGRGLGDTLANLARAEPRAWPEVLRLLRRRGLIPALLGRLAAADREVLRGVPPPPRRPLGADEGWPLFLAAWSAARAALGASAPDRGAPAADRPSAGGALPPSADAAFRLYLETCPAAPEGWDAPGSLGACVAAMVAWLLDRAPTRADPAAGEAALAPHPWIDPAPVRRVLRARAARAAADRSSAAGHDGGGAGADAFGIDTPAGALPPRRRPGPGGAMNRTRALRVLAAARLLAPPRRRVETGPPLPVAGADPLLELEDEVWAVDAAAERLAADGGVLSADAVLARIERDAAGAGPPPPDAAMAPPPSSDAGPPAVLPSPPAGDEASGSAAGREGDAGAVPPPDAGPAPAAGDGAKPPAVPSSAPAGDGQPRAPAGREAEEVAPPPRPEGPLGVVAAAARHLDPDERRELAGALAARARARPLSLRTAAAGVFFLVRPLADLGVPGLAARAGLAPAALRALIHHAAVLAAGAPEGDRAAEVVAWGGLGGEWTPDPAVPAGDARWVELARSLRVQGARLGLALPEAADPEAEGGDGFAEAGALLLEAACRQLVRWMRGFEGSSAGYVLKQVVRRPGAFRVPAAGPVEVAWPDSGLDVLLERAGYLDPLAAVPWWDGRGVRWER